MGRRPGAAASAPASPPADEGNHDVGGVTVEPLATVVVDGRGPGIGMTSGELDVPERHPGVEGGHDEGCPEHVRVDVPQLSPPSDGPNPPMGGAPVPALPRGAAEDRSLRPLTYGQVDHPGGSGDEGDHCGLGALAHDPEGPGTTIEAQVLDVGTAGLADPQAVQSEEDGERFMGVVEVLGGEEEPAELGAVETPPLGAVDNRAAHVYWAGFETICPSMWPKR